MATNDSGRRPVTRFLKWAGLLVVFLAGVEGLSRFRPVIVVGDSMEPSLASGDLLLMDRSAYQTTTPERGDVVVASFSGDLIVKRVVGTPGEEVCVRNGALVVQGVQYPEDGIKPGDISIGDGILAENRYALLGDNRSLPSEQIVHAVVSKEQILGKVLGILSISAATHWVRVL
jgi:signal peptidase I